MRSLTSATTSTTTASSRTYSAVYGPTFGRANSVVYPSLGNAEYGTAGAKGFFDYFSSVGVFARIRASRRRRVAPT